MEAIADKDDVVRCNAGPPKNSRFILESTDDGGVESTHPAPEKTRIHKTKPNHTENKVESQEEENSEEESDDEELSESHTLTHDKLI